MSAPATVIFDCDGVILQSNTLKSDAFAVALTGHEPRLVNEFVAWHKATGGVSRFEKFGHFFRETLGMTDWQTETDSACQRFGEIVSNGLLTCPEIPGLSALTTALRAQSIPLAVNTGGAQAEIRDVFAKRGMATDFEAILGSPTTKQANMERLRELGLLREGSVYLGDSALDFELAQMFDLRFIYVAYESEWSDGANVTRAHGGTVVTDLTELLPNGRAPLIAV